MRWKITKYVEARSLKDALTKEAKAEIAEIIKEELQEPSANTHAIGFHIPPDQDDL